MPELCNRAALYCPATGAWLHLAPFGPLRIAPKKLTTVIPVVIPLGGVTFAQNRHYGWTLAVTGEMHAASALLGLAGEAALRAMLRDGNGIGRVLDFQEWDDGTNTVKRVWRNCQVVEDDAYEKLNGSARDQGFGFALMTGTPTLYFSATGSVRAPSGPYESYLFNGEAEDVATIIKQIFGTRTALWPNLIAGETDGGNAADNQRAVVLSETEDRVVTAAQCVAAQCMPGATEDTVIRFSDTNWETEGNGFDVTIAAGAQASALVSGQELTITAGESLYIYPTNGEKHAAVQIDYETEGV